MAKLTDEKKRHIRTLRDRGIKQAEIAKIVGVSLGAVNKVVNESAPSASPEARPIPPAQSEPALSDVPDEIPEGTDLGRAEAWLRDIDEAIRKAADRGDDDAITKLMARATALLEYRRKAAPAPPPDPNANPDFVEAARRARERLHHLIKTAAEK